MAMAPGASWRNKPKLEVWSGEDFRNVPRLPDQGRGDEWWCLPAGVVDEYVAFVKAKIPAYQEHKRINAEKEAEFHKTYASRIYEAVRSGRPIPPPKVMLTSTITGSTIRRMPDLVKIEFWSLKRSVKMKRKSRILRTRSEIPRETLMLSTG